MFTNIIKLSSVVIKSPFYSIPSLENKENMQVPLSSSPDDTSDTCKLFCDR